MSERVEEWVSGCAPSDEIPDGGVLHCAEGVLRAVVCVDRPEAREATLLDGYLDPRDIVFLSRLGSRPP